MGDKRHPPSYPSTLSDEAKARIGAWHEGAYQEMRQRSEALQMTYLGLDLMVPPGVFAPTPMSHLLGQAVLDEVRESDRVLDMGTGAGANAILAASRSRDVIAVDLNPQAVACAEANAARNGVAGRVRVLESDVFSAVDGEFDLIIFDPPFRWFEPRDMLEASIADPGYAALQRFMREAPGRLREGARMLIFFGSSGDIEFLRELMAREGFVARRVATRALAKDGLEVEYFTWRVERRESRTVS